MKSDSGTTLHTTGWRSLYIVCGSSTIVNFNSPASMANTPQLFEISSSAVPIFTFDQFTGTPDCTITHTITSSNTAGFDTHPTNFEDPITWDGSVFTVTLITSLRQTPGDYTFYERVTAGASEYYSPLMTLRC